jgi:hypothetical protein
MNKQTICPSLRGMAAVLLLAAWPLLAQTTTPSPSGGPPMAGRRGGGAPCLQKAGINRSVMEQVHAIQSESRSQIASVCENSSLTPQQKHEQVQQIREQTKQKIDSLITPQQQEALRACRQEMGAPHHGMAGGGGGGPCGELHPNRPSGPNNNPSGNSPSPTHD